MNIHTEFIDNSEELLREVENGVQRALESMGLVAEGYAKTECPVNTGNLRNSITYAVDGNEVVIGTNVEYAPFVEMGTGIYAANGDGRKDPWTYMGEDGKWHMTNGAHPHPFLKPAVANHTDQYNKIIEQILRNG